MKKQGANRGATSAFLIATPESGIDSIAITYALLDPVMTVARPVAAFLTAITAGFVENLIEKPRENEKIYADKSCPVDNCCDGEECDPEEHKNHHSVKEKLIAGITFGFNDVWGDIVGWFLGGLLIAGLITAAIPNDLMTRYMGGGVHSMLIMLVIGVPLYICATASTPVAAALILKGVSPGAALVFLLAGPATNVTSLSTLYGILGRKATVRYITIISLSAVLVGLAVDQIYIFTGISASAVMGEAADIVPYWAKYSATFVLLIVSLGHLFRWLKKRKNNTKQPVQSFSSFPDITVLNKK